MTRGTIDLTAAPAVAEHRPRRTEPATMHAAVLVAPGQIEFREQPVPVPADGEVRIRLEGCGICGSNIPVWEGRPWFDYPQPAGAPGHEGWGVVDAVGPRVKGVAAGDRVAALSYRAFAEYDIARADAVVLLPAALEGLPIPGEPLGCAWNVFKRSDVEPGQTVAVVGVGFLGAILVRLAASAGARVMAVSRRACALQLARTLGAEVTFPLEDSVPARIRELTGGQGCDRVIEATGLQEPLDLAAELVRVRGRLIIAGYHQDGPRTVDMQSWNWRGIDVINAHERDTAEYVGGMRRATQAIADGEFDFRPLMTHCFEFRNLAAAFDAARFRPVGFLKSFVLMEPARNRCASIMAAESEGEG